MALEIDDLVVEQTITVAGKTIEAESTRNIPVDFPMVSSGSPFQLAIDGNERIERYLGGGGKTNTSYINFKIPEDFVGFPTNAFGIDTRRVGSNPTTKVTWYKNGSLDSTINNLEHRATATNDTWENKRSTPGSTYAIGDRVMVKIITKTNSGGGNFNAIGQVDIKYTGK